VGRGGAGVSDGEGAMGLANIGAFLMTLLVMVCVLFSGGLEVEARGWIVLGLLAQAVVFGANLFMMVRRLS
jgi:hypothetical protein